MGFRAVGLRISNIKTTTASIDLSGTESQWYYKADVAPHTTCQGPVASTTAESLTGLTANTTYTYSAYGNSGCTTLLDTAAPFTTDPIISVSNLGESHGGASHNLNPGQAVAQEFTTGTSTNGYTLSSVTVEFYLVYNAGAVTAAIHERQSNGTPAATARATLSGSAATGQRTYTCSTNCNLDASTSYFVLMDATTFAAILRPTQSDSETLSPANNGWSIANAMREEKNSWNEHSNRSLKIKVTATAR